jgi:hypothetical protein
MRLGLVAVLVLLVAAFPAVSPASQSAVRTVSAKLVSAAVTPKTKAKATGTVVVRLDAKAGQACWTISVAGGGRLLSAHVHRGAAGTNGPVVLPLGDTWGKRGCVSAPARAIAAVAASPHKYYVDVHTRAFVNGAVRGQLRSGA